MMGRCKGVLINKDGMRKDSLTRTTNARSAIYLHSLLKILLVLEIDEILLARTLRFLYTYQLVRLILLNNVRDQSSS